MSVAPDWLIRRILDFMAVIYQCYAHTNFANDRSVYARDIATAMGLIVDLRDGGGIEDVAKNILSPQTDKCFGDYWRQGEWGNIEAEALKQLKDSIRRQVGSRPT